MATQHEKTPGPSGQAEFDELQRGQSLPPTTETLEGATPPQYGQRREVPIPEPGERPGAIRVDGPQAEEPTLEETAEDLAEARALLPPA